MNGEILCEGETFGETSTLHFLFCFAMIRVYSFDSFYLVSIFLTSYDPIIKLVWFNLDSLLKSSLVFGLLPCLMMRDLLVFFMPL